MGMVCCVVGDFVLSSALLRGAMASFAGALNLNLAARLIQKHTARVMIAHSDLGHRLCVHGGIIGDLVPAQ